MRAVLVQDLIALARCMLVLPLEDRRYFARLILGFAEIADKHRDATGQAHPVHGDGTLVAALAEYPRGPARPVDCPDFGSCISTALSEVKKCRENHPLEHEMQRGTEGS